MTRAVETQAMKTQVFIDDGYPESREYVDNYHLLGDPAVERHIRECGLRLHPIVGENARLERFVAAINRAARALFRP